MNIFFCEEKQKVGPFAYHSLGTTALQGTNRCLETFHIRCLKKILGTTWEGRSPTCPGPAVVLRGSFATPVTSLKCRKTVFHTDSLWRSCQCLRSLFARWADKKKRFKDHLQSTIEVQQPTTVSSLKATAASTKEWRATCHLAVVHF